MRVAWVHRAEHRVCGGASHRRVCAQARVAGRGAGLGGDQSLRDELGSDGVGDVGDGEVEASRRLARRHLDLERVAEQRREHRAAAARGDDESALRSGGVLRSKFGSRRALGQTSLL